jgi:hypothetical protein
VRPTLRGWKRFAISSWLVMATTTSAWAAGPYVPTYTIAIPGFRSYVATGYTPSARNIEFIKALKTPAPALRLLKFDLAKNNKDMLLCRASFPVYGPNKTPFASLLEAAANLELVESGLAAQDAATVQATLDEFDFSSFGTGKWTLRATLTSAGKAPLVVSHEYTYPVSGGAVAACTDVTNALVPGIEAFLCALYTDPRFIETLQTAP